MPVPAGVERDLPAAVRGERLDRRPAHVVLGVDVARRRLVHESRDHEQDRLEAVLLKQGIPGELVGQCVVDGDQDGLRDADVRSREPLLILLERDRLVAVRLQIRELLIGLRQRELVRVGRDYVDPVVVQHGQVLQRAGRDRHRRGGRDVARIVDHGRRDLVGAGGEDRDVEARAVEVELARVGLREQGPDRGPVDAEAHRRDPVGVRCVHLDRDRAVHAGALRRLVHHCGCRTCCRPSGARLPSTPWCDSSR